MTDLADRRVPPERLRATFDPASLGFECTDELAPLTDFVGQDRAIRALQFGLGIHKPGYNIFVTGMTGTGKATAILDYIRRRVEQNHEAFVAHDWCYVYNFDDPDAPNAIGLPAGTGRKLREDLDQLLTTVRANIAQAFTSDDYERQRRQIAEEGGEQAQVVMEEASRQAGEAGFVLTFLPTGPNVVPMKDGRPMTAEEFQALTPEDRRALSERQKPVGDVVVGVGERLRALEREMVTRIRTFDRMVVESIVKGPFDALEKEHDALDEVRHFLQHLREHTLQSADFLRQLALQQPVAPTGPDVPPPGMAPDPFAAFRVNLLVDNSATASPPIVIEPNPSFTNLFGRIDRRAYLGTYVSDHTMLKPGALHRANGGYLILNFADVVAKPGAWDGLKRAIRTREVRLEDPMEQYGALTPQALRPEPIPTDVKLVITGDPLSYVLLLGYDEESWEMFKVKADFDHQIPRTPENELAYAGLACSVSEREGLRHFDRTAVGRLIEHGSRAVEDQEKLSARFGRLRDIIIEADYWAGQAGAKRITAEHVDRAIDEKLYRVNLLEERVRETISRGTIIIDTEGTVAGQVNGLAVMQLGDLTFGRPTRITARAYLGQRGIVSIDRESQLSGKIHDKGVLILSGYLGWKYGQERPLSLSATVSFEQGYDLIDGDSASCAETCAILSSLSGVPIRQDIAITGSMNQKGEVQPIGGANHKIEGFFDVCRVAGLSGTQGVIVPGRNLKNLMLRRDVVQAVTDGKFAIYATNTIDDAIEILTGVPAGERQEDGTYPEGTIHFLVDQKLHAMQEAMRKSGAGAKKNGEAASETDEPEPMPSPSETPGEPPPTDTPREPPPSDPPGEPPTPDVPA